MRIRRPRTHRPRTRRPDALRRDDGSLSIYFVMAVIACIPLVGLVVDGVGQIRAQQRTSAVAQEAARTAGQQIERGEAIKGEEVLLDRTTAGDAAREYAAAQGDFRVTSVVVSDDGHSVEVVAESTYEPIMLDAIGLGPGTLVGEGSAYMHRTDGAGKEFNYDDPDIPGQEEETFP